MNYYYELDCASMLIWGLFNFKNLNPNCSHHYHARHTRKPLPNKEEVVLGVAYLSFSSCEF